MIVSHKYRYIFIHVPKTAGSSISTSLAKSLGPFDHRLGAWDDAIKLGIRPNAQFYLSLMRAKPLASFARFAFNTRLKALKPSRFANTLNLSHKTAYPFGTHVKAEVLKDYVGTEIWDSYFKFCFVRNPFDRVVSAYLYFQRVNSCKTSFMGFLQNDMESIDKSSSSLLRSWELYTEHDQVAVDFVGRFESCDADFREVLSTLGMPIERHSLPAAKRNPNARDYREFYGEDERALVESRFAQEIAQFGYEF